MSTSSKVARRHVSWVDQPQVILPIDYSNNLTTKLVVVNALNWNKSSSYDPVSMRKLNYTSLANLNVGYFNSHLISSGSGSNYNYTGIGIPAIGGNSDITIFGIIKAGGNITAASAVNFNYGSYNAFSIWEGDGTNNRFQGRIRIGSTYYNFGSSAESASSAGKLYFVAARHKQGQQDLFVNGIKSSNSSARSGSITYDSQWNSIYGPNENGRPGGICMAWSRFLSDSEIVEISRNPYQIFQPQTQYDAEKFSGGQGVTTRKSWFLGASNPIAAPNSSEYIVPKTLKINPKFNLKNVIISGNGWKDKFTEQNMSLRNGTTESASSEGKSIFFDKNSLQTVTSPTPESYLTYNSRYSFVVVIKGTSTDTNYSNVFNAHRTGNGTQFQLRHSATDWYFYHNATAGWSLVQGTSTYQNNKTQVLVGTWDGVNIKLWVDGKYINSAACSGWFYGTGPSLINVGSDISSDSPAAGTYFDGHVNLVAFSARCWADNEAQQICTNPWQVFDSLPRKIYVDNTPKKLYAPALVTSKKTTSTQPQYKAAVYPSLNLSSALIPIGKSFVDCCTHGTNFSGSSFNVTPEGMGVNSTTGLNLPGYFQKGNTWTRIFISHGISQGSPGTISASRSDANSASQLQVTNNNLALNAAGSVNYLNAALDFTKLQKVVVTCSPTRQAIFANGRLISSRSGGVSFSDNGTGSLFSCGSEQMTPGEILLHADSAFTFNDSLAQQISINPWQIFQQPYNPHTFKESV